MVTGKMVAGRMVAGERISGGGASWCRCAAVASLLACAIALASPVTAEAETPVAARDDIVLGALVAEFLLAVAVSLDDQASGEATEYSKSTIAGAAQLSRLVTPDESATRAPDSADLDLALGSFLAFASKLPKQTNAPLSQKAAWDFACHLVGGDPAGFAELGRRSGIGTNAAKACAEQFEKGAARWNERVSSYRLGPGLVPPEGAGPLYVEIAPVFNPANEAIAETLRSSQLYDVLAEQLNAELAMPSGRVLLVTECGGTHAFYNPERREIVLCDERIAAWIAAVNAGEP